MLELLLISFSSYSPICAIPGICELQYLTSQFIKGLRMDANFPILARIIANLRCFVKSFFVVKGRFLKSALTPMKTADCATDSTST